MWLRRCSRPRPGRPRRTAIFAATFLSFLQRVRHQIMAHATLEALPSENLARIVRDVAIVEEGWNGLRILPLVSRTLLERLQDLALPVGWLRDQQALLALEQECWAAEGKRAWSVGEVDLRGTQVTDVSALVGCSSLHTLYLNSTGVTDVLRAALLLSLRLGPPDTRTRLPSAHTVHEATFLPRGLVYLPSLQPSCSNFEL